MRAFLAGGFWAILIGGGALAAVSVLADRPVGGQPSTGPQPDITEDAQPAPELPIAQTAESEPATLPEPAEASAADMPEPEAAPEVPMTQAAEPEPAALPEPAEVLPADMPEAEAVPELPSATLATPTLEAPAPEVPAEAEVAEPEAVAADSTPPQAAILAEALAAPAVIFDLPPAVATDVPVSLPQAAQVPVMPAQEADVRIETEPAPAPVAPVEVQAEPEPEPKPAPAPAAALPQITENIPLPEPERETMPAPAQETTAALPQSAPTVRVNRPGATPDASADAAEAAPEAGDLTPLVRYAADFDYAADLPMIAVVLLDNAMIMDAPAVLSGLPFVPTIVLNASAPDVTARMRAYRDAGIEVLLQADLPQGAQPSDVETTYLAAFGLVPEAIAVFSNGTGPEAADRALTDQALRLVGDEGRGFVTLPRGLGGALRNVSADGVPVAQIARELDGAGESRDAIERALQQAALRARQSGHVILLGRATPDTLAAIRNWAQRSDPAQISLAPVSAILQAQMPE